MILVLGLFISDEWNGNTSPFEVMMEAMPGLMISDCPNLVTF